MLWDLGALGNQFVSGSSITREILCKTTGVKIQTKKCFLSWEIIQSYNWILKLKCRKGPWSLVTVILRFHRNTSRRPSFWFLSLKIHKIFMNSWKHPYRLTYNFTRNYCLTMNRNQVNASDQVNRDWCRWRGSPGHSDTRSWAELVKRG